MECERKFAIDLNACELPFALQALIISAVRSKILLHLFSNSISQRISYSYTFPTFKKAPPYLLVVNHEKNAIFARLLQHIAVSAFLQDALLEQCSNHRRNEPCRA